MTLTFNTSKSISLPTCINILRSTTKGWTKSIQRVIAVFTYFPVFLWFVLRFLHLGHAISTFHWDNIQISQVACAGDKTNSFHESVTCSSIPESYYYCTHHMGHLYMAKMRSISLKNGFPPPVLCQLDWTPTSSQPTISRWQVTMCRVLSLRLGTKRLVQQFEHTQTPSS